MKRFSVLSIVIVGLFICSGSLNVVNAQGVGINDLGSPPDPSAILDASSTTKGQLMPRMTTAQRNAISNPAEGLTIFNTTTKCLEYFVYSTWQSISCATCPPPLSPTAGTHVASTTQIVWNWNTVSGATGYKFATINNYLFATDNGISTSYTQTGLNCNTPYTLYAWAYTVCSHSTSPVTLSQTTLNDVPASPTAGTYAPSATQIIWNWNTVSGATGYKYSAANIYGGATDIGNNLSYTQTGLNCNTAYSLYVWAYNTCSNSASPVTLTATTSACPFSCGVSTITVSHNSSDTYSPLTVSLTYGTVSYAGKCWTDRNLGASQIASLIDDGSVASAGWYWQFNRKQGRQNTGGSNNTPAWDGSAISEASNWGQATDPCFFFLGTGWRIPTTTDWNAAVAAGANSQNNAFASPLKIHNSGRIDAGTIQQRGSSGSGDFWSSNQSTLTTAFMYYTPNLPSLSEPSKTRGDALRCVKD